MENVIKILVCCHKYVNICNSSIYLPIQVGHALAKQDLPFQKDDEFDQEECDNLSAQNNIYCEMTGMYWAWKNIRRLYPDLKYVGLCHYRRYFYCKNNPFRDFLIVINNRMKQVFKIIFGIKRSIALCDLEYKLDTVNNPKNIISSKKLRSIIPLYDIIVTKKSEAVNVSIKDFFSVIGRVYIDILTEVITKYYPEYINYYLATINGNRMYSANMIILREKLLDEYCEFIFGVLNIHKQTIIERNICVSPTSEGIYSRISGYLAELLTSTYVSSKEKNLKIKRISKVFIENP